MKKLYTIVMSLLLLAASAATATAVGISPNSADVTAIIGGYTFDHKQHIETRPVYGIRAGYNFTSMLGLEALFDYVATEGTSGATIGGDVHLYRYGGDMLLHFMPDRAFVPFLAAGYSAITYDRQNAATVTRGIFDYGLGFKYFINDSVAFRGDVRHLIHRIDNNTMNNFEYTVGLMYHFGSRGGTAAGRMPGGEVPAEAEERGAPGAETGTPGPSEAAPETSAATEPTPGHYKYCVTLHIEFDIDSALIRPEYREEIAKVGTFMSTYPTTTAVIEGHTDNVGTAEHNMDLSQRRAESVVNYLAEQFGINRSRLTAKGYGFTRPIADNTTEEGKQKNRRIEAIIDCAFDVKEITPPDKLCMNLQIQFDSGSAQIKPDYRDQIAKLADYMRKYPSTTAVIEGHTDNVGSPEDNMKLSQQRAESVVTYLVDNFSIDRSRLSAKGYGDTRRIDYNMTEEGRQKNRRINAVVDCVIKK